MSSDMSVQSPHGRPPPPTSTPTLNSLLRMPPGAQGPSQEAPNNGPGQYPQTSAPYVNTSRADKSQSFPVTNGAWIPGAPIRPSGDPTHPSVAALRGGSGAPHPQRSPSAHSPQHHSPVSPAPLQHGQPPASMSGPNANGGQVPAPYGQQQQHPPASYPHPNQAFVQPPYGYQAYENTGGQPPQQGYFPPQGPPPPGAYPAQQNPGYYPPGTYPPRGPQYPQNPQFPPGYHYPPAPGYPPGYGYPPRAPFEGPRPAGPSPNPPASNGPPGGNVEVSQASTPSMTPPMARPKASGPKESGSLPSTPGTGTQSPGATSETGNDGPEGLSSPSWPQQGSVSQSPGVRQGTPSFVQPSTSSGPGTPKSGKEAGKGNAGIVESLVGNPYAMSPQDVMMRRQFYETLVGYTETKAHPITAQPTVSKQPVDLFNLYMAVRERGGFEQVTKYKKWKQLCTLLGLRESSNIGVQIRKRYMQFLLEYECERDAGGRNPQDLIDLVERMKKPKYAKTPKKLPNGTPDASFPPPPPSAAGPPPPPGSIPIPMDGLPPGSWPTPSAAQLNPNAFYGHPQQQPSMPPPRIIPPGQQTPGPPPPSSGDGGVVARDPFDDGGNPNHPYYQQRNQGGPYYQQPFPGPGRPAYYPHPDSAAQAQTPPHFASSSAPTPPASGAPVPSSAEQLRPYYPAVHATPPRPFGNGMDQPQQFPPYQSPWPHPQNVRPPPGPPFNRTTQAPTFYPPQQNKGPTQAPYPGYGRLERIQGMGFPPTSVESTPSSLRKRRKLVGRDVGKVDPWRLMMALKSGLQTDTIWALNILNILLYDNDAVSYFGLRNLPGLLDILVEHFRSSLATLFPEEDFIASDPHSAYSGKTEPDQDGSTPQPGTSEETPGITQHIIVAKFWDHLERRKNLRKRKIKDEISERKPSAVLFFRNEEDEEREVLLSGEVATPEKRTLCERGDWEEKASAHCLAISNILRGLVMVPGNESAMAKHPGLVGILGKLLRLQHIHLSNRPKYSRSSAEEKEETKPIEKEEEGGADWDNETCFTLREDAFVMISQLSAQLDLSLHDDSVVRPLLDSLLHWTVCGSTEAKDPFPFGYISPLRYSLESLCKISVMEKNVDLVLATPPWPRTERILTVLSGLLSVAEDIPVREFALVLVHALCAASDAACVTTALRTLAVQHLVAFLEGADASMHSVVSTHGMQALRENPELMGTSVGMLRRAASVLQCLSKVPACRHRFRRHQQRLLQFTMSQLMDSRVAGIIADTLFELQKPGSPMEFPMEGEDPPSSPLHPSSASPS